MDWILLELSFGVPGVFRVERDGGTCKAFLWDFKKLFAEEFTEQEVLKRAKDRNRSFEYDLNGLMEVFRTKPKEVTYTEGEELKLKYYIQKIPFHFHFRLQEDSKDFSQAVAIPLMLALKRTKDREEELLRVIERKDEEIQDYKSRDVSLINRFLETKALDTKIFNKTTEWDCIVEEGNKELMSNSIPGYSLSGYIPVEACPSAVVEETDKTVAVEKNTTRLTKRKIMKRIQSSKIGGKAVDFKYSQESQEIDSIPEEDFNLEPPPEKIKHVEEIKESAVPPVISQPKTQTVSQKPSSGSSQIKSKRRLNDVL